MASNKKNQKTAGAKPEIDEAVIEEQQTAEQDESETEESVNSEANGEDKTSDASDEITTANPVHEITVKVDAGEAIKAIHHPIASNGKLHARIEKVARAIAAHGGQERVGVLNQVELLTGRLKMVLPAAITATEDAELQASLETLLGLL